MTDPRPDDSQLPKGNVDLPGIRDVIEDILDNPDPAGAPDQPSGGGVIGGAPGALAGAGIQNMMKGLFVDRDKDGIIDVFEPGNVTQVRDDAKVEDFLKNALAQIGDQYQRGVENRFDNPDPSKWDGSELVEWAANRAGVQVNDNPTSQYRQLVGKGGGVDIDDALHTPGAILYEFNGDPINGSPTRASTAISLGDGRIIDIDPKEGVRIIDAAGMHFTHATVIPGFTDAHEPGAGTLNVVHEALVQHGIEEAAPPVEDTPEIAALAARAAELRARYTDANFGEGRTDRGEHHAEVERQQKLAEVGLKMANDEATERQQHANERLARAADLDKQATAAESRGDDAGAQELREDATRTRAAGESDRTLAEHARGEAAKYQQQLDTANAEMKQLDDALVTRFGLVEKGEPALDQLEQKVDLMRTANAQTALATDLDRRAADARAAGDSAQADQLAKQAQSAHATATRMEQAANGLAIDETTLQQIGDLPTTTGAATAAPAAATAPSDAGPDGSAAPSPGDTPEGTADGRSDDSITGTPTGTDPGQPSATDTPSSDATGSVDAPNTTGTADGAGADGAAVDGGGDVIGDVDAAAPVTGPSTDVTTTADDPAPTAAETTTVPDATADVAPDPSPGVVADASLDDASAGMQDFAAPTEPEPVVDTSSDDEL